MKKIDFIVPKSFDVKSAQRTYPVKFFADVNELVSDLKTIQNPVFLVDRNIRALYFDVLGELLAGANVLEIDATEDSKTFNGVGNVIAWLSEKGVTKANHVIAIGGGIIQDIATFSTCVFFRGLKWTLVPTTLLSMSDSCIGAKCGINLNHFKNQLGVFNSPHSVLIAPGFLQTLAPIDVKSGYGEIFKLYVTGGFEKFEELAKDLDGSGEMLSSLTGKHISESLLIKKRVIEEDEYEKYLRMILNYGHTLGHALESETNHFVPHGLGVVWGIDFENYLSYKNGWLAKDKFESMRGFIRKHFPFRMEKVVTVDGLLAASKRDKKMASASEINMIYFTDKNELEIKKTKLDDRFKAMLVEYLETEDAFYSR